MWMDERNGRNSVIKLVYKINVTHCHNKQPMGCDA